MNRKTILSVLLVLLLAGGFIGYRMYNKPHRDLAGATADFNLPATELFSDYEADEAEANAKYLDKVIRVSGTIIEVNTDEEGQASLTLDAGGLLGGVICQLDPAIENTFSAGQEISLNGLCTGMLMDVILVRCTPV
jgi:hypothetical protein